MVTSIGAEEWEEVDECWKLAKLQADAVTPLPPASSIKSMLGNEPAPEVLEMPLLFPAEQHIEEQAASISKIRPSTTKGRTAGAAARTSLPTSFLSHILTPTLCQLITALSIQSRFMDMISTVATVLSEGYLLDNRTWNHFIESLLDARPPLALLAFRLTERYLIANFPGWRTNPEALPNTSHRAQGLQHIKASYLRRGQLMPQYRTLVKLASALLQLSHHEVVGRPRGMDSKLERFVGTTQLIKRLAPRTVHVVQTLPAVDDSLQHRLMPKER